MPSQQAARRAAEERTRRALAHYRHRYLLRRDMMRAAGGDPDRYEQIARWWLAGW